MVIGAFLLALFELLRHKKSLYVPRQTWVPDKVHQRRPQGPLGWVRPVLTINGQEARKKIGLEAYEGPPPPHRRCPRCHVAIVTTQPPPSPSSLSRRHRHQPNHHPRHLRYHVAIGTLSPITISYRRVSVVQISPLLIVALMLTSHRTPANAARQSFHISPLSPPPSPPTQVPHAHTHVPT